MEEKKEMTVSEKSTLQMECCQKAMDLRVITRYSSDDEEATKASFAFAELLKSIDTSTLSTRDRIILEESIKVFESDFYGSAGQKYHEQTNKKRED